MNRTASILSTSAIALCTCLIATHARAQSDDDKKFLAMAAQGDQNEIALAKLAEKKAMNPNVKAFAELMVKEHMQLDESMSPFVKQWALTPPTGPDEDAKKEWDKLNKLSGKDFDKEYMDVMVKDHTKVYDAFEKEIKDTKDMQFQQAVMNGASYVAAHKNMAYDLKGKL